MCKWIPGSILQQFCNEQKAHHDLAGDAGTVQSSDKMGDHRVLQPDGPQLQGGMGSPSEVDMIGAFYEIVRRKLTLADPAAPGPSAK